MAVDLGDLIDSLKREVNPLGTDAFPDATDDDYLGYLQDGFWEAYLSGITVLTAWTELDGSITPVTVGHADITRDLQQLLVFFAGIRILRNELLQNKSTKFRAKAGPTEYETENSAQLFVALLKELQSERNLILTRLSDVGAIPTYYIDSLVEREQSMAYGDIYEASGGYGGAIRGYGPYFDGF